MNPHPALSHCRGRGSRHTESWPARTVPEYDALVDEGQKFHRDNFPAARRLRRPMTGTEALLWEHLRDRKFHGLKFRRQHPIGPYVADFFCAELALVLEIDGPVHNDPEQQTRDREREFFLQELGLKVVRISNSQVQPNLKQALNHALQKAQTTPLPPQHKRSVCHHSSHGY